MTKAEPNIIPDTKIEDSTPTRETLKLDPDSKGAEQPATAPSNPPLFDLESMTIEEKEQKAKEWGYIPKDKFKGDQSRHIGTDEYLRVSEQKMPALKNQLKKQDDIIASLRSMNESLNENIEQQKADISHQMQEASDDQNFVKFKNLEKREAALEKKQEDMKANLVNLENNHQEDKYYSTQEDTNDVVSQWKQRNAWYDNPITKDDFSRVGFAEKAYRKLTADYPNANPSVIMNQIDSNLNTFTSPAVQGYNYNPGGTNQAMGQPPSKDKTENNLTEGGLNMLKRMQTIARSPEERKKYTENFLNSTTNEKLFKWHGSNN